MLTCGKSYYVLKETEHQCNCSRFHHTHILKFQYFIGFHCAEINIDIDADALPPDRIEDPGIFGIEANRRPRPIPAETFIRACFKKLIGQGRDNQKMFLTDEQCMNWTKMISCLEDMDRKLLSVDRKLLSLDPKLLSVERDKLTLILYCPSRDSAQQLKEPSWISAWEQELTSMAQVLGKQKSNLSRGGCRIPHTRNAHQKILNP